MSIMDDYEKLWKLVDGEKQDEPSYKILDRLKNHIFNNPDDDVSVSIKDWVYLNMKEQYTNPDLINAFNMKDDLKYTKQLEIFKYLPFMMDFNGFKNYFWCLIYHDSAYYGSYPNFYRGCKWYCNELHPNVVPNDTFDKVINYADSNKPLMTAPFNYYEDLSTEYKALKDLSIGIITKEFLERRTQIENILYREGKENGYEAVRDYLINEKKGIVGEYFIFNRLSNDTFKTIFVAKEYGNGFGYDILCNNELENKEWLIEVKSTVNKPSEDTYFTLTSNEKDVLNDTLKSNNSEYIIERVFIDLKQDTIKHITLYYDKNNNCFYNNDYSGWDIKYVVDDNNPLRYNASITKKKTLTLKNNNQ